MKNISVFFILLTIQAFAQDAFPVDTHIHRLLTRWGLTSGKSVEQTEKDAKDCFSFQQKMFEVNFSNMMNLYLDASFAVQAYVSKNIEISSQYNDKNLKCFTGEII